MHFMGYIRPDGTVGTRNHILVISCGSETDHVAFNVASAVEKTKAVYCGSFGQLPSGGLIAGLVGNPNVAGAIVLQSLAQAEDEKVAGLPGALGKPLEIIDVNNCGGTLEAMFKATRRAAEMVRQISAYKRQAVNVSRLIAGLLHVDDKPAQGPMGHCINRVVNSHGRFMAFTPTEDKNKTVFGSSVAGAIAQGQKIPQKQGVYAIESPSANQAIGDMIFAGAQVIVSNTGSVYRNLMVPVINLVTGHGAFELLPDNVELELNMSGRYNTEDYGLLIINEILATASGKLTKAEILKA